MRSPTCRALLIASGADVAGQARLRHASAKTTLDTYGHQWPDRDESTRAAVDAALVAREESVRNAGAGPFPQVRRAGLLRCRSRARTRAGAGATGSDRSHWPA